MAINQEILRPSINGKKWFCHEVDHYIINKMIAKYDISEIIARIIATKQNDIDNLDHFLDPKIKNLLPDPFHLLDMDKAVTRTLKAILAQEKICIFGDYDVDGATSSALIKNIFSELGVDVLVYIPDRINEGYGPNEQAFEELKTQGVNLVITVDCGATSFAPLAFAKEIGLDVIVLDHHMGADKLPEAVAIVNPNRLDETSPFCYLAAVGVSFLFLVGVIKKIKEQQISVPIIPNLLHHLDLVALGTVCDVMPLIGLNRAFVKQGLKVMAQRRNLGLSALADIASLADVPSCYHLGFILGPRINAGGRVGKASLGSELLTSKDSLQAQIFARDLDKFNQERQEIEQQVLQEAFRMAEAQLDSSLVFVHGEKWHVGVIGIVAGRLKEKFNKPTIVMAISGNEAKASCRSIKGIDLGAIIAEARMQGLLVAGGGHAMAAGFTLDVAKIQDLYNFIEKRVSYLTAKLSNLDHSYYNAELPLQALNLSLIKELELLEPCGTGNSEPLFRINNLFVARSNIVGSKHISCILATDKKSYNSASIKAIAFNCLDSDLGTLLLDPKGRKFDVIAKIKLNRWQEKETVQLIILDVISGSIFK